MSRFGKLSAALTGIVLIFVMVLMVLLTFTYFVPTGPAWLELDPYGKALVLFIILGLGVCAGVLLYLSSKPTPSEPLRSFRPRK